MGPPAPIDLEGLLERYDVFLLDSYGVLVDSSRALPGAIAFIERLNTEGKPWLVLSNDASRLTSTSVSRYHRFGLPIDEKRVLTSGDLIAPRLRASGLVGKDAIVLGPRDSLEIVRRAGARVIGIDDPSPAAVIVCDDEGYPFLPALEQVISTLVTRLDAGNAVELLLPNPDLVYPKGPGRIGITAGSVALLIEAALRLRFPSRRPTFVRLGKPHRPMFDEARRRLGSRGGGRIVMLGDQLATDIAGAEAAGIDSVLVGTGLTDPLGELGDVARPTWRLASLEAS